jgi:triacylglycerol esterase/lipase EstA (alpha/beta hydrolase family)
MKFARGVLAVALAAASLSVSVSFGAGTAAALPPSVNNWACQPTEARPHPVVLLHGLGASADANWGYVGPRLAADGYCTFALTYGPIAPGAFLGGGFGKVAESAQQIAAFIVQVLEATGASEVDLVGHSEGGFMTLYVPKTQALGASVAHVVALAPPSTARPTASGVLTIFQSGPLQAAAAAFVRQFGCFACDDLGVTGGGISELNDGPITVPGVDYTIIASRFDVLVTPMETSFVREEGVHNVVVQDQCPFDFVGHGGLAFDPGVYDMITNALSPEAARPVRCSFGFPF